MDMPESAVPEDRVTVECPAGSAVLFHINIVHGGGPNLSQARRRNVIGIWAGPDTYPTTANRYAYEFVMPRSTNPERQKQIQETFGHNRSRAARS
jgi:ectoine hydroxylase-related dioxygenase (phytanoyl-CoA dioxygenase family)